MGGNMKGLVLFVILSGMVFASGLPAEAANHYIRSGASGSGTGADWTYACKGFSGACAVGSLVRGDTYYVGAGSYPGITFNTPDSGTSLISIIGATAATNSGYPG